MAGRLQGKVALITGAARGQGRSHAVRLAEEGADIIAVDICEQMPGVEYPMATEADLAETVRLVEQQDRRIVAAKADVRQRAELQAAVDDAVARLGRLDFVIANAGVMPIWGEAAQREQAWHDCLDVMLTGTWHTLEVGYPHIVRGGAGGSIVCTGSMAAWKPMMRTESAHNPGNLGYAAAKLAVTNLARNFASMLASESIRVNVVNPSGVDSPMLRNSLFEDRRAGLDPEDQKVLQNALPVPVMESIDVSNAVLWLCSEESRYFTGNSVYLDAGVSLR